MKCSSIGHQHNRATYVALGDKNVWFTICDLCLYRVSQFKCRLQPIRYDILKRKLPNGIRKD